MFFSDNELFTLLEIVDRELSQPIGMSTERFTIKRLEEKEKLLAIKKKLLQKLEIIDFSTLSLSILEEATLTINSLR